MAKTDPLEERFESLVADAKLKLDRAQHHINCLNREINAFLAEKPFTLVSIVNENPLEVAYTVKEHKTIPDVIPLTLGDAIHNMRSALDIVIFAMIGDKAQRPWNVQFPFARSAEGLESTIRSREIQLASEQVVQLIKRSEPHLGGDDGLYGLYELDVRDKHKLVLTVGKSAHITGAQFRRLVPSIQARDNQTISLQAGATIKVVFDSATRLDRRRFRRQHPLPENEIQPQPAFQICFGEGQPFSGHAVIGILLAMMQDVGGLISALAITFVRSEAAKGES